MVSLLSTFALRLNLFPPKHFLPLTSQRLTKMSSRTTRSTSSGGTKPQTQAPAKPRKPSQRVVLADNCPEFVWAYEQDGPAKAWALYLQEAEGNARDQVEVWKTGLESLLIFVRRSC